MRRILVTNDDGIRAEGLDVLVKWARDFGEVTVVAPKTEQSGKSHSIEIRKSYEVRRVLRFGQIETYSVDSTPADCVRIAILGLKKKFDLVVAGVNNGPNVGGDIYYSGTVAACHEAALLGVRSIAFSTMFNAFDSARRNLDNVFYEINRRKLFDYAEIVNVNFPEQGDRILFTRVGPAIYTDEFKFYPGDMVEPRLVCLFRPEVTLRNYELDTEALMSGFITVTPLLSDMSDLDAWDRAKKMRFED